MEKYPAPKYSRLRNKKIRQHNRYKSVPKLSSLDSRVRMKKPKMFSPSHANKKGYTIPSDRRNKHRNASCENQLTGGKIKMLDKYYNAANWLSTTPKRVQERPRPTKHHNTKLQAMKHRNRQNQFIDQ